MATRRRHQGAASVAPVELSQGNPEVLEAPSLGAPPAPSTAAVSTIYAVAPGRSITTRSRGIVPAGQHVYPSDFSAGERRLAELVAAGYVVAS